MNNFHENFAAVKEAVGAAVTIVGVVKRQPYEKIAEAIRGGLRCIGDNYVQEGLALREALGPLCDGVAWHFVGHVQSRKAKLLAPYNMVQSLDRIEIAETLNERVPQPIDVLIEINLGSEESKSGIALDGLDAFLKRLERLQKLRVRGLMAMPPPLEPAELRRPFFKTMRKLFESHRFDTLSMGTSADYKIAVDEGATMIRLGTTLFGARA